MGRNRSGKRAPNECPTTDTSTVRRSIRNKGDRGATLVEFAIVAPLLFLLLLGIIEFGRAVATFTAVTTAAREGARYGTTIGESDELSGGPRYLDCVGIRNAAKAKATFTNLSDSAIEIRYDNGPSTSTDAGCQDSLPTPTETNVQTGDRIVVVVTDQFTSPIPLISSLLDLEIRSEQSRTIFRAVIDE